MPTTKNTDIDLVEITKIPRTYMTHVDIKIDSINHPSRIHSRYERFLGAMMHSNLQSGFRIQTIDGKSRLFYLIQSGNSEVLQVVFLSQFSGFDLLQRGNGLEIDIDKPVYVAEIRGVPKPTTNALDGLAESMIGSECPMLYQVWTSPTRVSLISRKIAEKKYETALGKAQKQDNLDGVLGSRETRTRFDAEALRSSKHLEAAYERSISDRVLECRVILASWGSEKSRVALEIALNTLLGTISHTAKREKLTHRIIIGERAYQTLIDALGMKPTVRGTKLLPSEVVPSLTVLSE